MTRQEANLEIIEKLRQFFIENPDIRFFQGLQILELQKGELEFDITHDPFTCITDNFHEESTTTLNKLK